MPVVPEIMCLNNLAICSAWLCSGGFGKEIVYTKVQVDAGAEFVVTQTFMDTARGTIVPIVPRPWSWQGWVCRHAGVRAPAGCQHADVHGPAG